MVLNYIWVSQMLQQPHLQRQYVDGMYDQSEAGPREAATHALLGGY